MTTDEERIRILETALERSMRAALQDPVRKEFVKAALREVLAEEAATRKSAMKEGFKELIQEHLARLGGWGLTMIGTAVVVSILGLLLYFGAIKAGWTPPK